MSHYLSKAGTILVIQMVEQLLEVPIEIAADRQRNHHHCERNCNLHGVIERRVAHESSPFEDNMCNSTPNRH